jgi:hypothetical protein
LFGDNRGLRFCALTSVGALFYFTWGITMQHDIFQLYEMNIHSLRNIAREVGVKSPTTLTKKALIDEILQMERGIKQPCMSTKKGRPPKNDNANKRLENEKIVDENAMDLKNNMKKEFIACILKEIEKKLINLL